MGPNNLKSQLYPVWMSLAPTDEVWLSATYTPFHFNPKILSFPWILVQTFNHSLHFTPHMIPYSLYSTPLPIYPNLPEEHPFQKITKLPKPFLSM